MNNEKTPKETKVKEQTPEKKTNAKAKKAQGQKKKPTDVDRFGFKKGSNRSVFS